MKHDYRYLEDTFHARLGRRWHNTQRGNAWGYILSLTITTLVLIIHTLEETA